MIKHNITPSPEQNCWLKSLDTIRSNQTIKVFQVFKPKNKKCGYKTSAIYSYISHYSKTIEREGLNNCIFPFPRTLCRLSIRSLKINQQRREFNSQVAINSRKQFDRKRKRLSKRGPRQLSVYSSIFIDLLMSPPPQLNVRMSNQEQDWTSREKICFFPLSAHRALTPPPPTQKIYLPPLISICSCAQ